jgi:hypothetical protein
MQTKTFKKLVWIGVILFFVFANSAFTIRTVVSKQIAAKVSTIPELLKTSLYDSLQLQGLGLSKQAYEYAMAGYSKLLVSGKIINEGVLSIIDFSLPSSAKRLFIIDVKNATVLFNTYVSHGRNSGKAMANEFSNNPESFKSSLGFYITSGTYFGKHGYAMRLVGEEKGINDNAFNRGIVMHSAAYVSEKYINSQGYIGRSEGCPAIPSQLHKAIIEKIKNGSCLFMYSPVKYYSAKSALIQANSAA